MTEDEAERAVKLDLDEIRERHARAIARVEQITTARAGVYTWRLRPRRRGAKRGIRGNG